MQMIRPWIFSIHTKQDANMCLKFTQPMKFGALCVALEKNKGQIEIYSRSGEYVCVLENLKKLLRQPTLLLYIYHVIRMPTSFSFYARYSLSRLQMFWHWSEKKSLLFFRSVNVHY